MESLFFAAATTALLLNLGATTSGLRIVTADDEAIFHALTSPVYAITIRMHDFRIGRIYADLKFQLLEGVMCEPSEAVHTLLRLMAFMIAVGAAAWFAWAWRRSSRTAWLVVVGSAAAVPVSIGYQALLSFPLLWLGWAGVWVMGALALRPTSALNRCGLMVAFAVALAVHEGNAVFIVWPAWLRWISEGRAGVRAIGRELGLCGAILTAYLALSWWLRGAALAATTNEVYEGARLSPNVRETIFAWIAYTGSGLPGFDSWLARTADPGGPLWLSFGGWWQRITAWSTPATVMLAGLAGVIGWIGMAPDEPAANPSRVRPAGMIAALVFAAFAPNLMLGLTLKYQTWAHHRMWPYYYTGMSFLAWVVLAAGGAGIVLAALRRSAWRHTGRAFLAIALVGVVLGVAAANRQAADFLRRHPFYHMGTYRAWFAAP